MHSQNNRPPLSSFDWVFVSAVRKVTTIPVPTRDMNHNVHRMFPNYTKTPFKNIYIATQPLSSISSIIEQLHELESYTFWEHLVFVSEYFQCINYSVITSLLQGTFYWAISLCICISLFSQLLKRKNRTHFSLLLFTGPCSKSSNRKAAKHSYGFQLSEATFALHSY